MLARHQKGTKRTQTGTDSDDDTTQSAVKYLVK